MLGRWYYSPEHGELSAMSWRRNWRSSSKSSASTRPVACSTRPREAGRDLSFNLGDLLPNLRYGVLTLSGRFNMLPHGLDQDLIIFRPVCERGRESLPATKEGGQ